jgi:hypothetical protein
VTDEANAAGASVSKAKVNAMLRSLMYVNGEYAVKRRGVLIACEPVQLGEYAIPMETFQRVAELRAARRGKRTDAPEGTNLLNGILFHECGCELRTRLERGARSGYRHKEFIRDECKGLSLDADIIDAAVCRELLRLASCRELQEAWTLRMDVEQAEPRPILSDAERQEKKRQIARFTQIKEEREADFRERLLAEEDVNENDFAEMVGSITSEIEKLTKQLEHADAIAAARAAASSKRQYAETLLEEIEAILTPELPDDHGARARRRALVHAMVSKVIVYTTEDGVELELYGPLVPEGVPRAPVYDPLADAAGEIADPTPPMKGRFAGLGVQPPPAPTISQGLAYDAVGAQALPPLREPGYSRRTPLPPTGEPAWRSPLILVLRAHKRLPTRFPMPTVARLAELALEGKTYNDIVKIARAERLATAQGGEWRVDQVRLALNAAIRHLPLEPKTIEQLERKMREARDRWTGPKGDGSKGGTFHLRRVELKRQARTAKRGPDGPFGQREHRRERERKALNEG